MGKNNVYIQSTDSNYSCALINDAEDLFLEGCRNMEQEHYQKAETCFTLALNARIILHGARSLGVALVHKMLGDVLYQLKKPGDSKRHYLAAKRVFETISCYSCPKIIANKAVLRIDRDLDNLQGLTCNDNLPHSSRCTLCVRAANCA